MPIMLFHVEQVSHSFTRFTPAITIALEVCKWWRWFIGNAQPILSLGPTSRKTCCRCGRLFVAFLWILSSCGSGNGDTIGKYDGSFLDASLAIEADASKSLDGFFSPESHPVEGGFDGEVKVDVATLDLPWTDPDASMLDAFQDDSSVECKGDLGGGKFSFCTDLRVSFSAATNMLMLELVPKYAPRKGEYFLIRGYKKMSATQEQEIACRTGAPTVEGGKQGRLLIPVPLEWGALTKIRLENLSFLDSCGQTLYPISPSNLTDASSGMLSCNVVDFIMDSALNEGGRMDCKSLGSCPWECYSPNL